MVSWPFTVQTWACPCLNFDPSAICSFTWCDYAAPGIFSGEVWVCMKIKTLSLNPT